MERSNTQKFRVMSWLKDNKDKTLRLDYDLNEDSVVFDVGGYLGESTHNVFEKFKCNVYVFEPVKSFYDQLVKRFAGNKKIKIYNFGLSGENRDEKIMILDDKSSLFKSGNEADTIKLVDISGFIKEEKIERIDLIEINIEGGEYELIERLIKTGDIKKVENLQVQFHDFVDNAADRMKKIQNNLNSTHYATFAFEYVWENWRKKPAPSEDAKAQAHMDDLYSKINFYIDEIAVARRDNVELKFQVEEFREAYDGDVKRFRDAIAELEKKNKELNQKLDSVRYVLNIIRNSKANRIGLKLMKPFYILRDKFSKK